MNSGVYRIRNLVNNKQYIGSTDNFKRRKRAHSWMLNGNRHHSRYLQNAYNKYGIENFIFEVLEYCEPSKENLLVIEQKYLDLKSEYNMTKTAGSIQGYTFIPKFKIERNRIMSEDTKKKISDALTGRILSQETKDRMSVAQKGKVMSEESKLKMSNFAKTRTHSQESKDKMSIIFRGVSRRMFWKAILKIDSATLEVLEEYDSVTIAAKILNIGKTGISSVLTGRLKTYKGFIWKYK